LCHPTFGRFDAAQSIPHRTQSCGYLPIRNDAAKDGMWKIEGKRQAIYARSDLSVADQLQAPRALVGAG